MSPSHREELSAFIDGALERDQAAFLLRRLEHDRRLRDCYEIYHLIGDCLRHRRSTMPAPAGFADRIDAAVRSEALPGRPRAWQPGLRWAAGFATAAIVAAGSFWYVQPRSGDIGLTAGTAPAASEVRSSGISADDLRRQLPLLPVSARSSRPAVGGEFAPQPGPEAWQQAPVTSLHYPSTQYIIVLPVPSRQINEAAVRSPDAAGAGRR